MVSKQIIKTFRIEVFFICYRCQEHRWCTLSSEYLREFSGKKIKTALMGDSGAWGKLIHEKKPEVENLVTLSH
jgi:hypothetical protein